MTRNHFSKKGGPYFISDGFSKHTPEPEDIKPDTKVLYFITIGFGILLATIGILLNIL